MSSLVGVEFPLSDSDSESLDSLSDSAGGEAGLGTLRPLSTEPRGARSTPISGSTEGRGGRVGAGVASPEAVARLSEERERGMSVARSGSGGAENRSEKPPPDLAGGSSPPSLVVGAPGCSSGVPGLGIVSGGGRGGCGRAGGGFGLGGGPGLAGLAEESDTLGGSSLGLRGSSLGFGGSSLALGGSSLDLRGPSLGLGGSSLGLGGPSEGREGGGGLEGGAGRGGGGLTGATSRLRVMSLSSSKLS